MVVEDNSYCVCMQQQRLGLRLDLYSVFDISLCVQGVIGKKARHIVEVRLQQFILNVMCNYALHLRKRLLEIGVYDLHSTLQFRHRPSKTPTFTHVLRRPDTTAFEAHISSQSCVM